MNPNTPNTSSNYTFEPMSRRSSLCPPHHESDNVLSPPLTPALSQHHPFDKRHSADLSAYSNNPYNPRPTYSMDSYQQWMHHSATMQHMQQQQQLHHHHHQQQQQHMHHHHQPMLHSPVPNMAPHQQQLQAMPQQQQIQERSPIVERASSTTRKQPSKQNKHMCTFPECFWSFKRFEHLKRHMLVHTGERPHVCPHPGCGKRFSRSDNFHAHYRTHEKKAFARQKNNNTQQQQQHQDTTALNTNFIIKEEKDFMQPFYQHQSYPLLPSPSAMYSQHYTTMLQQEASPTPSPRSSIQSSSSSSTSTVSSTEDKGEQKKPHACSHPTCNRKFRRLEHLKRHMRIHTHEQPFKCNYPGCLKAFSRSDNLTQHRKTHERRGSRYQAIDAVVPITTTDYMHPSDTESFTFDFIRDSHNNNSYDNNSKQHSILGLQYPGDTATESVGC